MAHIMAQKRRTVRQNTLSKWEPCITVSLYHCHRENHKELTGCFCWLRGVYGPDGMPYVVLWRPEALIAGCSSLQRLGVDSLVTRPVWDSNLGPHSSESRSLSQLSYQYQWERPVLILFRQDKSAQTWTCWNSFVEQGRISIKDSEKTLACKTFHTCVDLLLPFSLHIGIFRGPLLGAPSL